MSITNLSGKDPITAKAAGILNMQRRGLPVPESVLLSTATNETVTRSCISRWIEWVYVRLIYSDTEYPHYMHKLCRKGTLREAITHLVETAETKKIRDFDLLLQPMLEFHWSGAVLKRATGSIVEVVCGAPKTLLRDGIFRHRYYIDPHGRCVSVEHCLQPEAVRWKSGSWCKTPVTGEAFPLLRYISGLHLSDLDSDTLYEVGFANKKTVFLDAKGVPVHAFPCLSKMPPTHPFVVSSGCVRDAGPTIEFETPAFSHIKQIHPRTSIRVKNGAMLSHFSLEMIRQECRCVFA